MVIANVTPSTLCSHETHSTLQFAERAKCIQNRAVVNQDTTGDIKLLQAEIEKLQAEVRHLRDGMLDPSVLIERDAAIERLARSEAAHEAIAEQLKRAVADGKQVLYEKERLDRKLVDADKCVIYYVYPTYCTASHRADRSANRRNRITKRIGYFDSNNIFPHSQNK